MSNWRELVYETESMLRDEGASAITRIYIDLPDIGWRYVSAIDLNGSGCIRATVSSKPSRSEGETTLLFPGEKLLAAENLDLSVLEMTS